MRLSMGRTILALLAGANALLFVATLSRSLNATALTPALKAGMGFFGCMTLVCAGGYLWLIRRARLVDDLIVGERIVAVRLHRDVVVFKASHCVYFAGVTDGVAFRKALSGLVVGTHVFYLDDGPYLTNAGVLLTVGRDKSRSAIVFMRSLHAYVLRSQSRAIPIFD